MENACVMRNITIIAVNLNVFRVIHPAQRAMVQHQVIASPAMEWIVLHVRNYAKHAMELPPLIVRLAYQVLEF
jgi:hypothetical protein